MLERGPASAQRSQFESSHSNIRILNYLLDMPTRSRAPDGRLVPINATTDPTGGGGETDQEPDLSANTEPEPPVHQGWDLTPVTLLDKAVKEQAVAYYNCATY